MFSYGEENGGISTVLKNFDSFDEFENVCKIFFNQSFILLMLQPNKPIIVDKKFNLNNIFETIDIISLYLVAFVKIKGIDVDAQKNIFKFQPPMLTFMFSKLDFYYNNTAIKKEDCNLEFFNKHHQLLSDYYKLSILYGKFPDFLCPFVFMNSTLYQVTLFDVSNSYLNKNRINFIEVNDINITYKNMLSRIRYLRIQLKYETMTSKILNKYVFRFIEDFRIEGVLVDIQSDLFKNFKFIKNVDIRIENFKAFFHRGNHWLKYLNEEVKINLYNINEINSRINEYMRLRFEYSKQATSFDRIYEYPEEDICLFKDFPHDHLVYPMIVPGKKINCSCTIIWLLKNYYLYVGVHVNQPDYEENYSINELRDGSFFENILYCVAFDFLENYKKCNFDDLQTKCNKSNYQTNTAFSLDNDMDLFYLIKSLQFILLIVLNPIFCFFGIINNLLAIVVISNKKKKKDFKDPMYKHIRINAFFNIIYCIIMLLKLINQCLFYTSDLYCSSLFTSTISQYFKIIIVNFFGNAIKLCTNCSYILFSISRYTLVSSKTKGFFKKFTEISLKKLYFSIILVFFLISLFKNFQYKPNYNYRQEKDFPYEYFDDNYCKLKDPFLCNFFNSMKIFNNALNDIVFVCINIIFDLLILKQFRDKLKNKDKVKKLTDKDKSDQKKQKDHINKMVIVNSILYLISHMPEFVVSILLIIYTRKISNFCLNNLSCDLINEEAEFFNIMSIVFQFYVFKAFNKNFDDSYLDLKKAFFSKK
jgi:hypothetical protein